mmetsp:Transcript_81699/g.144132  ORF Transcript_81699/g.144132 Transcript_81699/m.144132 type:complete len:211 (-) Transcript_81699:2362-2994(-)
MYASQRAYSSLQRPSPFQRSTPISLKILRERSRASRLFSGSDAAQFHAMRMQSRPWYSLMCVCCKNILQLLLSRCTSEVTRAGSAWPSRSASRAAFTNSWSTPACPPSPSASSLTIFSSFRFLHVMMALELLNRCSRCSRWKGRMAVRKYTACTVASTIRTSLWIRSLSIVWASCCSCTSDRPSGGSTYCHARYSSSYKLVGLNWSSEAP